MDERLKFAARPLDGISDRSRPYRQADQLPFQVESRILQLKQEHASWGAPKSARQGSHPAGSQNLLLQARLHAFIDYCCWERPHQALGMHCPANCYRPVPRPYRLESAENPFGARVFPMSAA